MAYVPTPEEVAESNEKMDRLNALWYYVGWKGQRIRARISKKKARYNKARPRLTVLQVRFRPIVLRPTLPGEIPATYSLTLPGFDRGVASYVADEQNERLRRNRPELLEKAGYAGRAEVTGGTREAAIYMRRAIAKAAHMRYEEQNMLKLGLEYDPLTATFRGVGHE